MTIVTVMDNTGRVAELAAAFEARDDAEKRIADYLKSHWPVNSMVHWQWNGHIARGNVLHHSGDRIKVRNSHTGAEYWIYAYRILYAYGARF